LRSLTVAPRTAQPKSYSNLLVPKPWGFEFQLFDNRACCIWVACLKPGHAVSMHCHQRKQAAFLPLSRGVSLVTLDRTAPLTECVTVDCGVFHSQENNTDKDVYFLEYETPSDKADIVRYSDRYGRADQGYESVSAMVPLAEALEGLKLPKAIRTLVEAA
jgi:mannose-6-phosphate isomerase-like protein (cupin superfamily)